MSSVGGGALIRRRTVVFGFPAAGFAALGLSHPSRAFSDRGEAPVVGHAIGAWPGFPQQDPALVREVVGAAHRNEGRVRELVEAHPGLVNAWWDWGFGDWESPLGAASHTGRRSIAEYLISRGARVDIFAAAMLGWSEVVRSSIEASPGIQRTLGPHGLTLAHHARAGGQSALDVLKYLDSLPDADISPASIVIDDSRRARYTGTYRYGTADADWFEVKSNNGRLEFIPPDGAARVLIPVADHEFFPSGVPTVRFRFEVVAERSTTATIVDHDLVVIANCSQ